MPRHHNEEQVSGTVFIVIASAAATYSEETTGLNNA